MCDCSESSNVENCTVEKLFDGMYLPAYIGMRSNAQHKDGLITFRSTNSAYSPSIVKNDLDNSFDIGDDVFVKIEKKCSDIYISDLVNVKPDESEIFTGSGMAIGQNLLKQHFVLDLHNVLPKGSHGSSGVHIKKHNEDNLGNQVINGVEYNVYNFRNIDANENPTGPDQVILSELDIDHFIGENIYIFFSGSQVQYEGQARDVIVQASYNEIPHPGHDPN